MEYSRVFGSNYPNSVINLGSRKDVDNTVISLINQYNYYIQTGDMINATNVYEENKTVLEPYIINTEYINRLEEEIYNTGIYAIKKSGFNIVSEDEPVEQDTGDYWFKDY